MRFVRSGRNGPGVSEMGLGSMGMSGGYGHADDAESIATIHAALEADITMLDTGDFDAAGGRWFGNYETPAVISKVGKAKAGQGGAPRHDGVWPQGIP